MQRINAYPVIQAILAAILFGISTPLSKLLIGDIEPIPLASFLYLGSGIGLLVFQLIQHAISKQPISEAPLLKTDIPWLLGSIFFGGVLAPIILLTSLKTTPASTASLLLNFEGVATTLIALLIFKEYIGKRVGVSIGLITLSSILLSWNFSNQWGFSLGSIGVIVACICWGIDNNFTRNISSKNPFIIVIIKGLGAGLFSFVLSLIIKSPLPGIKTIIGAMLLGFFSYGFSTILFVLAMRNMGCARTSAFFSMAPFIGTILSFILFRSSPDVTFIIAIPIMILGAILLMKDNHEHTHIHISITHEHQHFHDDEHHTHTHETTLSFDRIHSHIHTHQHLEHTHHHLPDIQHRHCHF